MVTGGGAEVFAYPLAQGLHFTFCGRFGHALEEDGELLAAQAGKFVVFHRRLDMHGHALEHDIADIVAETVVDLLEVVDIDHRQVLPRIEAAHLPLGLGHEGAAVGDLGERVDVGLVEQHLGQVEVVQLGLAHLQVAVDHQAAEEHRVGQQHRAFEVIDVDPRVVERVEHRPADRQCAEERPAPHRQYRHRVEYDGHPQYQPHRAQLDRDALDDQAHAQGDDGHEQQVEHVEVMAATGEAHSGTATSAR